MDLIKNLSNALLFRLITFFIKIQLIFQLDLGLLNTYAPNAYEKKKLVNDKRESKKRLEAILKNLPTDKKLTTLDIGCNLGFFTFNMAKLGGFCIGIDYGRNEILAAKALAFDNNVKNAVFTQMEITPLNSHQLPKTDLVICLSIFHHWIRKLGEQKSFEIMKGLSSSTNKYFIFDTGQPNEKNVEWNKDLRFMEPDIESWAKNYFKLLGFTEIKNLGEFKTSVSEVPRKLFLAIK